MVTLLKNIFKESLIKRDSKGSKTLWWGLGRSPRAVSQRFLKSCLTLLPALLLLASGAEARDICVRLTENQPRIAITSDGAMTLTDASKKKHSIGRSATLTRSGSSVTAGRNKFPLPVSISTGGLLGFNGRKYRGEFLITKEFLLINVVDVEAYVCGVLPAEASSKWPGEYLKVQAIISRTYGLRQSLNRSARGYDVVDSTSDQVYKGAGVETPTTNQAVKATEGQVLAYGNELAFTPFHSDSGGFTATNAHVWGRNIPYLRGVMEPVAYESPNSSWSARVPASQVQSALSKAGASVGKIKEIRVSEFDTGGRATTLTFVGSSGSTSVRSSNFRTAIGSNVMKSTLLTLADAAPAAKTPAQGSGNEKKSAAAQLLAESPWLSESFDEDGAVPKSPAGGGAKTLVPENDELRLTRMTSDGVFTAAELMDMLMNPEKRGSYLDVGAQRSAGVPGKPGKPSVTQPKPLPDISMSSANVAKVIPEKDGYFTFSGRGWGHGVGLSQWGAQALAREGWSARRILEHYYPGTAVKNFR